MAYVLPSVQIFQEFGTSPLSTAPELKACIVGPKYKYLDFLDADDKLASKVGAYDSATDTTYSYPARAAGEVVDLASVKMYLNKARARLFDGTDGTSSSLEKNVLRSGTSGFYFKDFTSDKGIAYNKDTSLHNRGVKEGDLINVTNGTTSKDTRVIGFKNEITDAVTGSFTAASGNHESAKFVKPLIRPVVTFTGTGTGGIGARGVYSHADESTVYTVTCTVGGALGTAVFSVQDTESDITGTQLINTVAGKNAYPIGNRGITLVLVDASSSPSDSFKHASTQDVITITCTAAGNAGDGVVKVGGSYTGTSDLAYTVTLLDGGVTGVARINVTTPNSVDDSGPHLVKAGEAISIGSRGVTVTFDFPSTGVLVAGDSWSIQCRAISGTPVLAGGSFSSTGTVTVSGSYSGAFDAVLFLDVGTTGAQGTATFDWTLQEKNTAATRKGATKSGSITTSVNTSDVLTITDGIGLAIANTASYAGSDTITLNLFAGNKELPVVSAAHDTIADAPSMVALEAIGTDASYPTAGNLAAPTNVTTGTLQLGGRYYSNAEIQYTLTTATPGALGVAVITVGNTSGSADTGTITTVAGVTRYYVGTRGVFVDLSSDFVCGAGALVTSTDFTAAVITPSVTLDTGYTFTNKLKYTLTCITPGGLGTAEFSVTTPGNVDNVASVTSAATMAVGSRGVKVALAIGASSGFTAGETWEIDTAVDSKFTGAEDDTYTVEVTRGGGFGVAEVSVSSLKGDARSAITLTENTAERFQGHSLPIPLGSFGGRFVVKDTQRDGTDSRTATFVKGDKWTVPMTAAVTKGLQGLVLADNLPTALLDATGLTYSLDIDLRDVEVPAKAPSLLDNFTADATTLTSKKNITLQSADVYDTVGGSKVPVNMPIASGADVHFVYTALSTASAGQIDTAETVTDIVAKAGKIDPRNPLGYAVSKALANSNIGIKFLAVASDDAAGYLAALDALAEDETAYAICPLTQDQAILASFKSHVDQLSLPEQGKFRIAVINQDLVERTDVYVQRTDSNGALVDYTATIKDDPDSADLNPPIYTKVEDSNAQFLTDGVKAGDLFLTDYTGDVAGSTFKIDRIVSDTALILAEGPTTSVVTAQKYQITRPLNKDEQAVNHAAIASGYQDHRVYLVYPDELEADGQTVKGFHLCAAICGMVAAFPPHQGFTNLGIAGFTSTSRSSDYFSTAQLNTMAGGGVYLVVQNAADGQIYSRHQVSTDGSSTELRELSITKNFDALSFAFQAALEPFIGLYNINAQTLAAVEATLKGIIEDKKSSIQAKIGAPLLGATINTIKQDPLLKDHLIVDMDLQLPFPLNVLKLTLRV